MYDIFRQVNATGCLSTEECVLGCKVKLSSDTLVFHSPLLSIIRLYEECWTSKNVIHNFNSQRLRLGTRRFVSCWKTGKEEISWKTTHRWEDNIKIDLKEICLMGRDWIMWFRIGISQFHKNCGSFHWLRGLAP
jgi:hypothetical protein